VGLFVNRVAGGLQSSTSRHGFYWHAHSFRNPQGWLSESVPHSFVYMNRRSDMSSRMVRSFGSVILFLILISSVVFWANAAEPALRTIVVVRSSNVEDVVLDRVVSNLKGNLNAEISIVKIASDLANLPLDEQVKEVRKLLKPDSVCAVALVKEPAKTTQERILVATNQLAGLVNVTVIKDMVKVEGNEAETNEQYLRLAEKESMRTVGSLLGLKPCPNPYCAMNCSESKPVARVSARNYCPPCQGELEKLLPVAGEKTTPIRSGTVR
jgi:predicted Zn-dependent protease